MVRGRSARSKTSRIVAFCLVLRVRMGAVFAPPGASACLHRHGLTIMINYSRYQHKPNDSWRSRMNAMLARFLLLAGLVTACVAPLTVRAANAAYLNGTVVADGHPVAGATITVS